ncbi:hypothetical protein ACVW02_002189 [Ewingella americana]
MISITDKGKQLEEESIRLSETLFCSSNLELKELQRLNQEIVALRDNIAQRNG